MKVKSAGKLAGMAAVVGGMMLMVIAPAGAGPSIRSVKITPASNEKPGSTITVTYSGFTPHDALEAIECNADDSIAQDGSGCDLSHIKSTMASATGGGSFSTILSNKSPIGSSALGHCPLSAADYKAGVHCVYAVASPANHADNATVNLYFAPGKVTATAVPLHSGTSTITIKGAGWATMGLPSTCTPATGAPAAGNPFTKCTSVVGEVVTIMVNGVKVGTATAQPGASGAITFTHSVTLKKGTNTITLSGGTSKETATATIVTTA
jgi:hypothetical protein